MKLKLRSSACYFFLVFIFAAPTVHAQTNSTTAARKVLRAGAATTNITPKIGTSINGLFQDRRVRNVHDETHARCLVLDDGQTCLAIVVMDLCAASREMIEKAKVLAHKATGIPTQNMLISATHSHSAGTAAPLFQSSPDSAYVNFLIDRAADAIILAYENRRPARIGWAVGHEPTQVFNRRWKMKPGTPLPNPFGGQDQVKMNPGPGNPALIEPAGPVDTEVPVISVQSYDSVPIAVLANYSLHYVGGTPEDEISADYYGFFASRIGELLSAERHATPFVGIMTNGTSGDINNVNVAEPNSAPQVPYMQMRVVANIVAAEAYKGILNIKYQDWISLAALQEEISLGVRKPGKNEIKRAQDIVSNAKGAVMMSIEEVYARETLLMRDYPDKVSIILQTLRIGDLAITAIPNEVFAEIGLELKAKSPFRSTVNIGLANGYYGYLPTPEQHRMGGYETWRARSSYLEVDAAPKITSTLFSLLNKLYTSHIGATK